MPPPLERFMKLYQVDSFTAQAFTGNPAGVWIGEHFPDATRMQQIAAEMNLSETAFVACGKEGYRIRYFTPTREVPLCGHATLASAHILREAGYLADGNRVILHAPAAAVPVSVTGGWVTMRFPVYAISRIEEYAYLEAILGATLKEAYKSDNGWIVARLIDETALVHARPHFPSMENDLIAATAEASAEGHDYSVRVFCHPSYGIEEDPVTGAAQCILAPYWSGQLGKTTFSSRQLSQRGGEMKTHLHPNGIDIVGRAVTVFAINVQV